MGKARVLIDAWLDRNLPVLPDPKLDRAARIALVRQYGDFSTAWLSAVQPGLRYFGGPAGYLAYGMKMGQVIALGDPVAAPDAKVKLLADFLALAPCSMFVEISVSTALALQTMGRQVALFGFDTELELTPETFSGSMMKSIRYRESWNKTQGFSIKEIKSPDEACALAGQFNEAWRKTRVVGRREMGFINRQLDFGQHDDPVRRFFLFDKDGAPEAFIVFEPMFRHGRLSGYVTALKRRKPTASAYAEMGLTKSCADIFQAEQIEVLSLGLAPLAGWDNHQAGHDFNQNRLFCRLLEMIGTARISNGRLFNFRNQAAFKRRFHGAETPRYIAHKPGFPVVATLAFARLTRMI
ncbi:phosphatidylglycerol lysyltransferase domain-containing protein [Hoeflea sp. YIM 152468]|uniref:phosphatidylglycerol lysyltransferase domain-containing protein n=1 Tax=Hoeflea sp. YIM 152468 TaxID=3031759 RepID=UPI0023DCD678|nr:phosphatidylglycerol lysyltransferase domain-containing protein [Hoeflea sp. YIM 152468]MDF1609531.1 phosphatidylglycerol lysyltransferase domain-containing protein [Hoeflea sp. YIM 152468]